MAFAAGVASFIAPCTLALVPGFVVYVAGFTLTTADRGDARRVRLASVANSLAFAAGFIAIFVALGTSLGAVSEALTSQTTWLSRVGGALIIAFGLIALRLLRIPALERGFTFRTSFAERLRYLGSFLVGATFGVSWIPCVGPILGAVLVLAGTSGSALQGAIFLAAYALGMMLPFIGAGVFSGWTGTLLRAQGRVLQYTTVAGGLLMIALGIVVFTDTMPLIVARFPIALPALG